MHWSLNDKKSIHVSRTRLSILANLNNIEACMVPIFLLIYTPSIFCSQARSKYLSIFFRFFIFTQWFGKKGSSTFFLSTRSELMTESVIRLYL